MVFNNTSLFKKDIKIGGFGWLTESLNIIVVLIMIFFIFLLIYHPIKMIIEEGTKEKNTSNENCECPESLTDPQYECPKNK
jgi:uncharacterized membrane protein